MKYLTLIRHAKSSWEQPDIDDMVRPLNPRGKESTILLGNWFRVQKIKPDAIICSPATRSLHTAINIASWINFNKSRMDIDQAIYFGGTKAMAEKVAELDNSIEEVFMVGHEPYLSELVNKFTGDELEKFPTCAAYRICWEVESWDQINQVQGSKHTFMTPKMLLNKD
jgi:phosphohistidine phosphatase